MVPGELAVVAHCLSNRPPYKEGWLKKPPFFRETWAEYMRSPPGLSKTTSADVSADTLGQLEMLP